jgi:hypothetical protein
VIEPQYEMSPTALDRFLAEMKHSLNKQIATSKVGAFVDGLLRRTDLLFKQDKHGRIVIICPETDTATCTGLARRIEQASSDVLGLSVSCGIASFPAEAVTFQGLFSVAKTNLNRRPDVVDIATSSTKAAEKRTAVLN